MRRAVLRWKDRTVLAAMTLFVGAAVLAGPASAASLLEKNFWLEGPRYDAVLPPCDAPAALDRIAKTFSQKESKYWNSQMKIVEFFGIRELAFRPWAVQTIPRRFCGGTVVVSTGRRHRVYYSIIEDGGLIGATWGVEWCVVGFDRNWAYNPACRMARP